MNDYVECPVCKLVYLYEGPESRCPECAEREAERRRAREAVGA